MRLRIVGSSSSVPRPGRACSCYLLRTQSTALLLDLGTGALANLRQTLEYTQLAAVVVSHMHADHFLDVIPLRYGLKYGPPRGEARMPLYLPPGGDATLRRFVSAFAPEGPHDFLDEVFDVREYEPNVALTIGDLTLRFRKARHYIDTFSIRAECGDATFVYSADTAPCDALVEHAAGAGLFLCEATLGTCSEPLPRGHCTPAEAGEMARRAGVERLMLTHYGAESRVDRLEAAAAATFGAPVAVADDGDEVEISSRTERSRAAVKTGSGRGPAPAPGLSRHME